MFKARRVLSIFLMIVLFSAFVTGSYAFYDTLSDQESPTIGVGTWPFTTSVAITTAQEFYDMATSSTSDPEDRFHLENDIDFSSFTWTYTSAFNTNRFKGTLDGMGYSLNNLSMESTDAGTIHFSIFSNTEGATIKNISVNNFSMGITTAYASSTALESAIFTSNVYGTGNVFENITITNSEVYGNSLDGAGGLITSVRDGAELLVKNIKTTNLTVLNTSKRSGGIICRVFSSSGQVTVEDVDFHGYLGADNRTSNTGGIAGTVQNTGLLSITRSIVEYTAEGTVTFTDGSTTFKSDRYVGGFIGNNNNVATSITDSFYTGILYNNTSYMGSAVGRAKSVPTLNNVFYSNVLFQNTYTAPTNAQGLHGTLVNETSMPSLSWWNTFATSFYSANSLWQQDVNGRLELIR